MIRRPPRSPLFPYPSLSRSPVPRPMPAVVIAGRQLDRQIREPELFVDRNLRSEEHTSELQSLRHLVCRLLLEKKHTNDAVAGSTGEFGLWVNSNVLSTMWDV